MTAIVEKKLRRMDRKIAARNLVECIAGAVLVVFFGWTSIHAPTALIKTGCLVIAASAAWIVFYVIRHGNSPVAVDPSQNLVSYTQALLGHYDHQIRLLKSVKFWYLLPLYVGLLITSAGLSVQQAETRTLGWHDFRGPAIYTSVFAVIWWLNEVVAVGRLRKERALLLSITSQDELDTSPSGR